VGAPDSYSQTIIASFGGSGEVKTLSEAATEVIATGGLAEPFLPHSRTVQHYEPWLTLYGLRIIFDRNR